MTLLAQTLTAHPRHPVAAPQPTASGFVDLDERVAAGGPGLVLARSTSTEVADALLAHLARRGEGLGAMVIEARAQAGCSLWREVASRLGLTAVPTDPPAAARVIRQAASARLVVVLGPLPAAHSWDRVVTLHMASHDAPLVVLISTDGRPTDDLPGDTYDVGPSLDAPARQRWWAAIADAAVSHLPGTPGEALVALDSWWETARRRSGIPRATGMSLEPRAARLLAGLALAGRAWPRDELHLLTGELTGEAPLRELVLAGAVRESCAWVSVEASWDARATALTGDAPAALAHGVALALAARFERDPWALCRASELLVVAGHAADADAMQARALVEAADSMARREIVARWMAALSGVPDGEQLRLRVLATERALAVGEADEAFRWAQSAALLAPNDPSLGLVCGRAAVALGDLVSARVALERAAEYASDDASRALVAAEMAEVAYLGGDLVAAAREAERALALAPGAGTQLKARNTQGKLLLAASRWDEADRHFARDAWTASAEGLRTDELRARLNRGIALLSKGFMDEARAVFEAVLLAAERAGDARACAFAVENLAVVATLGHDYAQSLALTERTLKLRERIGDRLKTALALSNLAELRRRLGLLDHAEHAVFFGRRALGPGVPPAHSTFFSLQAARTALLRGNTLEARREAARALAESEAAGLRNYVCEACCISARVALEDGDLARAAELLERARPDASTDELRAEVALVAALHARSSGLDGEALAVEALGAARASGKEDLIIEAHALLAEIHRAGGHLEAARAHVASAFALRDQIAGALPEEIRRAFLARPDLETLDKLHRVLSTMPEPAGSRPSSPPEAPSAGEAPARPSSRPPPASREIIGDDPAIRGLLAAIRKVARSSSTVLVRGESGTGKELVAEGIHRESERAAGPLVTVNCAALVETLLLSELFGHEKGAFTGAIARRRGRFEMAEGGTLFLDEIGDISPRTQVALLRVLQERTFERVGGVAPIRANVRVICATHRDLKKMVERGEFREDLYYRLRGITLEVAPLRARLGDLPRISEHLLARIASERGEGCKVLSADALELLGRHRWPGNVRELENALRAASLFAEGDTITAATLADNVDDLRVAAVQPARRSAPRLSESLVEAVADDDEVELPAGDGGEAGSLPPSGEAGATAAAYSQVRTGAMSLPDIKRQIERDCVARALAETQGNITRAAALLGMKRPRLSQLVKQYGLAAVSSEGT